MNPNPENKKVNQKQQAQYLYMAQGYTQKEIADIVGVSERTIYTWVHNYNWDKLRLAACQAPATIADNLCSQIVELQNNIAYREPGKRFPTQQEAEVIRKLVTCLEKMKKYPSLSQNMQVLETFRNFIRPVDKEFTRKLGNYVDRFISGKSINGYAPYTMGYGVEPVNPLSSFYDEVDEPEDDALKPCTDTNNCPHPVSGCEWPHCNHPEWYAPPVNKYSVPNIHYEYNQTEPEFQESQQPAATGSFPAFARHSLSDGGTPAATGSNPAIFKLEKHENSFFPPEKTVEIPAITLPAATGSDPAVSTSEDGNNLFPHPSFTANKRLRAFINSYKAQFLDTEENEKKYA